MTREKVALRMQIYFEVGTTSLLGSCLAVHLFVSFAISQC